MPRSKCRRAFYTYPECESRVACDGNALRENRLESRICGKCEKALERRGKVTEPKGINFKERNERKGAA